MKHITFKYSVEATCTPTEKMERAKSFKSSGRLAGLTSPEALKLAGKMRWSHTAKREAIRFAKSCTKSPNGFSEVVVLEKINNTEVFSWTR